MNTENAIHIYVTATKVYDTENSNDSRITVSGDFYLLPDYPEKNGRSMIFQSKEDILNNYPLGWVESTSILRLSSEKSYDEYPDDESNDWWMIKSVLDDVVDILVPAWMSAIHTGKAGDYRYAIGRILEAYDICTDHLKEM